MRLIGLTGSIGAGKSVVSRILRLKGYAVYDCDSRARILMENSSAIKDALVSRWGEECLDPGGNLNRPHIASKAFAADEERIWLNSLVHSAVREDIAAWKENHEVAFVESAILATSELDRLCDSVWVVDAPEELRIKRAVRRDGGAEESVRRRNDAQKEELCNLRAPKTRIIENIEGRSLLRAVDALLEEI